MGIWPARQTMLFSVAIRVGLEAGFGFGFRKPGISRKGWLSGRPRLSSIQKLLASDSATASLNAGFDGFGFSLGFVMFLRPASASAWASRNFVSGFRGSTGVLMKPVFTNSVLISIYLQATFSTSIRSSCHLCISSRLFSVTGNVSVQKEIVPLTSSSKH